MIVKRERREHESGIRDGEGRKGERRGQKEADFSLEGGSIREKMFAGAICQAMRCWVLRGGGR